MSLIEPLEQRITLASDVSIEIISVSLPDIAVPGDMGKVKVKITSVGDTPFTGQAQVRIFMNNIPGAPLLFEAGFSEKCLIIKNLGVGTHDIDFRTQALKLSGPALPEDTYHIVARVQALTGSSGDSNANNNVADSTKNFQYVYQFGKVGARTNVVLIAKDADKQYFGGGSDVYTDGTRVAFGLSGGGTGEIDYGIGGIDLTFTNTTAASKAAIVPSAFTNEVNEKFDATLLVPLGNVVANTPLAEFSAPVVNFAGNLTFNGGVEGFKIGALSGTTVDRTINLGAGAKPAKIVLGRMQNVDLTAGAGIASLEVVDWLAPNADPDTIDAPFIGKLRATGSKTGPVAGDFEASLSISGGDAKGNALGAANILGQLRKGTWTFSGADKTVGEIAANSINAWKLVAAGPVKELYSAHDLRTDVAAPSLSALYFGQITAVDTLVANIVASGRNAKGLALERLSATTVDGAVIDAGTGGIGKIDLSEWLNGGTLGARSIGTLTVDGFGVDGPGDFTPLVNLLGQPDNLAFPLVGAATIGGQLVNTSGTPDQGWTVGTGEIRSLRVASIGNDFALVGGVGSTLGRLVVGGEFSGLVKMGILDNVSIGGEFNGQLEAVSAIAGFGTVKLAKVMGGTIETPSTIEQISALSWFGGSIKGSHIGKITILGNTKLDVAGDLSEVTIEASGDIGAIQVADSIFKTNIKAGGVIGLFSADQWSGAGALPGSSGMLEAAAITKSFTLRGEKKTGTIGDLFGVKIDLTSATDKNGDFKIAGTIGRSTITAAGAGLGVVAASLLDSTIRSTDTIDKVELRGKLADGTQVAGMGGSAVIAPRIAAVAVHDVDPSSATSLITADKIARYTRYVDNRAVVSLRLLDAPGTPDEIPSAFQLVITDPT